jgi:cobalt-zinc-cadmium resistance protein CzcA
MFLRPKKSVEEEDVWLVRKLKSVYAPFLDYALGHRGKVLIVATFITIPVLILALYVGSDFMPKLNEGAFLIQTVLPPEASLDEVDRVNHRVEDELRTFPEVEDVVRRTGRAERSEDPMPHTWSDVLVILKPGVGRSPDELEDAMRKKLHNVLGATALFTTPLGMRIDEGLGGTPADISVRIFGSDLDKLAALGERAQELMQGVKGIEDLRVEKLTGMPQLRVSIDRQAVARVGLTPGDVIRAIRVGMAGEEESEVWIGQRRFDLIVRLQDDHRNSPKAISSLLIDGHDGSRIPLSQLATIEQTFGPGTIRREAGSRRVAVEAAVHGRDLGSTAAEISTKLSRELTLPTGYFFNVGGRVESQSRAVRSLTVAIAVAIIAVFLLLYLALGSAAETVVILATLPTASVGGIAALLIGGETWNVSSLVGLIGLFGIAVQNGLVLISQTRGLLAEGMPFEDALRGACIGRVRPKIMTAATAILGLLPLLVLRLHGTEIERPLALVMIGGLVTSTMFTLLALPTFYMTVHRLQERMGRHAVVAEV